MSVRPVILMPHVNTYESRLSKLNAEVQSIRSTLDKHPHCRFIDLSAARMDDIRDKLGEHAGLTRLFHFSGHGNERGLELGNLDNQTRLTFAEGLAELIAAEGGLSLLFLNACSTHAQVEHFINTRKIKVVIATTRNIRDDVAFLFAKIFYQEFARGRSIRQAFDLAHIALKTDLGNLEPEKLYRDLLWVKGNLPQDWEQPYQLHSMHQSFEEESLESWCKEIQGKEPDKSPPPEISPSIFENVNRDAQKSAFQKLFARMLRQGKREPQIILVQGTEDQLPDKLGAGLIRHLLPRLLSKAERKKLRPGKEKIVARMHRRDFLDGEGYQTLIDRLKAEFELGIPDSLKAEELLEQEHKEHDILWIEHTFYESQWHESIPSVLQLYIEEFWQIRQQAESPYVFIVCHFIFSSSSRWQKWFSPTRKEIEKNTRLLSQKYDNCHLMPQLEEVNKDDLTEWLRTYKIESPIIKQKVYHMYDSKPRMSMADIQAGLEKIIQDLGNSRFQGLNMGK